MLDLNEYIESGVLELYVAGALPPEEVDEVEKIAAQYPEVRNEIEAISATVEALLLGGRRNPPPELRPLILDKINQTPQELTPDLPSNGLPSSSRSTPPELGGSSSSQMRRYLLAASISITILASGTAGYLGYQLGDARQELTALRETNTQMAQENSTLKAEYTTTNEDLAVLLSPDWKNVELTGTPTSPEARAVVYWDPHSKSVRLGKGTLPPPPAGKQYQLWAIAGTNPPVDAGVLAKDGTRTGLLRMKDVASADAFAVTLENEGGSPTPTLEAMVATGKVAPNG